MVKACARWLDGYPRICTGMGMPRRCRGRGPQTALPSGRSCLSMMLSSKSAPYRASAGLPACCLGTRHIHEQDAHDISLQVRLSVVLPALESVSCRRRIDSRRLVRLEEDGSGCDMTISLCPGSASKLQTHTAEAPVATRAATPATIMVAAVSFCPVPPIISREAIAACRMPVVFIVVAQP